MSTQTAGNEIQFINKDTGWVSNGNLFKTTDGGFNWVNQSMPNFPPIVSSGVSRFFFINRNKGWGVGGVTNYGGNPGIVWATTNGGLNWGYQQPDTTIQVFVFGTICFADSMNGWTYNASGNKGIHTTNGGGQIMFTGINVISSEIPKTFKLYQNYPNPFNSSTKIKFQMSKSGYAVLKMTDILGREIFTLVNQILNSGIYEADFEANNFSSGIYFYRLIIDGNIIDTKKMILIK